MEHMQPDPGVTILNASWARDCRGMEFPYNSSNPGGGTFIGHAIPGLIFTCWGLWMAFSLCTAHQRAAKMRQPPPEAQPWHRTDWLRWLQLEPFLKAFVTPLGPIVELYLDHPEGWLPLYCPDGSFLARYTHNYQHASSYLGFIVSGLVDFLGMVVKLPQGTQQVFLGLAFFLEGFLMLMHKKHEAFDAGVHWLLGTTMWAAAAFVWLQLRYPRSLWLGLGRAASCLMQGIWLWQIATFMFTGRREWKFSGDPPVAASLMMMPVVFAMLMLVNAVVLLCIWVASQWWTDRTQQAYLQLPQVRQELELPPGHSPRSSADLDGFALGGNDSARESQSGGSDGGGGVTPPQKPRSGGPGVARQQLRNALQVLRPGGVRPDKHSQPDRHAC